MATKQAINIKLLSANFLTLFLGYAPPNMPPMVTPPGAPGLPQMNGLPRPPTLSIPPTVTGMSGTPTSGSVPPTMPPSAYQPNAAAPQSGGFDSLNANSKAPDSDH